MDNKDKEAFNKIKDIVKFNMKISCGYDCSTRDCSCRNKLILDIVEERLNEESRSNDL